MAGVAPIEPKKQFCDALGVPMAGGSVDVYLAGTTTRTTTWQDKTQLSANTNPIVLDSRGECVMWVDDTLTYKFVLKNAAGVTQWTVDNVIGGAANLTQLSFVQDGTGAVTRTAQDKMRDWVSPKDFGALGNGSANDTAAVQLAINYGIANSIPVRWPAGTYLCGALTVPGSGDLIWEGAGDVLIQRTGTDVTLISPTGNVYVRGMKFLNFTNGFRFNSVSSDKRLRFHDLVVTNCGTTATSGGRVDFNAFISCNTSAANVIELLEVMNCHFDGDDFAICYRSGFKSALVQGCSFANMKRMGLMLGDNLGNQLAYQSIRVMGNSFRDIISDDASEQELHAVLCYGYRVEVAHNQVHTVRDINLSTHDSEALYVKAVLFSVHHNEVVDGGRGDGMITAKGSTLSAATEIADIASGTAYSRGGSIHDNKIYMSDDFYTSYTPTIAAIFTDGAHVDVKNNKAFGTFDRFVSSTATGHIHGNEGWGTFNYGILAVLDVDNIGDAKYIKVNDNHIRQEGAGSAGILIRISSTTAVTVDTVQIDSNTVQLGASGSFANGEAAFVCASVFKVNSGNNTITNLQTNNNNVLGRSGSQPTAILVLGTGGSGSNGGKVTNWAARGNSGDQVLNCFRVDMLATGDVTNAHITDAHFPTIGSRMISNASQITTLKAQGLRGQRPSETSGTATLLAGGTSTTVNMNLQDTLRPTSLANVSVRPTSAWGNAAEWWISNLSGDTFNINVDADPGGSGITFAWEAKNLYYY